MITRKAKEAIKTALAMTIAYGISLQMGWEESMWAGFAVAFISLATIGQSFNKAALRMAGTLIAMIMALTLIALFAQDRWLFMIFLSAWIGFCTYKMGGKTNQYFWNVSGFACVIICMDGGLDPVNAFNTAMLRTQQTGLGILVYSLVAMFLWPVNSRADFDVSTRKLATIQQQLYQFYMNLLRSPNNFNNTDKELQQQRKTLRMQEVQVLGQFEQLLSAALTDNYEISELRRQWNLYHDKVIEFSETMARWSESFAEIQTLDLQSLLPNLGDFGGELDERLTQINRMQAGNEPVQLPRSMHLSINQEALKALSFFNKAAFTVAIKHLQTMELLTRELFDITSDIKGFSTTSVSVTKSHHSEHLIVPDVERMMAAFRVIVGMWIAYLALIYVNDLPGGGSVVTIVTSLGMAIANMPQISVSKLIMPAIGSIVYTSLIYIFVMPQLSSFFGLGLLLFAVTFSICYLFSAPQQMLNRAFGLALFVAIAAISNEQTYSFFSMADTSLMFGLIFFILIVTAYIPFSPQPEKSYLRLLGRFFRSSGYLIATMNRNPHGSITRLERWEKEFHLHELISLPQKLAIWGKFINPKMLPNNSAEQMQKMTTNLEALTYRMQDLLEVQDSLQAKSLVQEFLLDIHSWQSSVQEAFQHLSEDPAIGNRDRFQARLTDIMAHFEVRIKETFNKTTYDQLSAQDSEKFYRLLGACRGVSEALIGYTASTVAVPWSLWQEERF